MNNFIIISVIALFILSLMTVRSYLNMSQALNAKEIHEKMVKDRFWKIQESFED